MLQSTYHIISIFSFNSINSTDNTTLSPSVEDIHWDPSSLNLGGNFGKRTPPERKRKRYLIIFD